MKSQAVVVDFDPGVGIDREGGLQGIQKTAFELSQMLITGPKLIEKGGPTERGWLGQGVQAVSQPDIDVDGHALVGDVAESRFGDRNRMILKCTIECFAETNRIHPNDLAPVQRLP